MFTGLVESLAEVVELLSEPPGVRISIADQVVSPGAEIGDSIAINGCCLTVVEQRADRLSFEAGEETLSRTNLGKLSAGDRVNLESSLKLGDPLGGHYVTGHIDAVGTVRERIDEGQWCTMWFHTPQQLMRQIASKGSIAVDGVSLTLVDVSEDQFSVALIPHTLAVTTLGLRQPGDAVNLETDVLAKYVHRQLEFLQSVGPPASP